MPPLGDARDLEQSRDWGLGPEIVGSFSRATVQTLAFLVVPMLVLVLGLDIWQAARVPLAALLPLDILGLAVVLGFVRLSMSDRAVSLQVGERGVAISRSGFWGGRHRAAWILWADVELTLPGAGRKYSRTLGVRGKSTHWDLWEIDYGQARAIIEHPRAAVTLARLPPWLSERLSR
jgi:hypothetical protein